MSLAQTHETGCSCPRSLQAQFLDFRRRVWTIKMVEAVCAAAFGVVVAFLLMFAARPRLGHAGLAPRRPLRRGGRRLRHRARWRCTAGSGGNRRLEQLARLLDPQAPARRRPAPGIIELVRERLRAGPVARRSARRPSSRSPRTPRSATSATPCRTRGIALGLAGRRAGRRWRSACSRSVPAAAVERLGPAARPLEATRPATPSPRSSPCPTGWSSPTASRSSIAVQARRRHRLAARRRAMAQLGEPAAGRRHAATTAVRVRAARRRSTRLARRPDRRRPQRVRIEPTLRPELTSVVADVTLPDYLGRPGAAAEGRPRRGDLAGQGEPGDASPPPPAASWPPPRSTASRRRRRARPSPARRRRSTAPRKMEFRWQDTFGLAGKEPFTLAITGRDDEAPSLVVRGPAAPEGRARLRAAQLQGPGPGRLRRQARRHGVAGGRRPGRHEAGQGRADPGGRRPRQGVARASPAPSRPSRWASSRSRSTSGSSPRIISPAGRGSTRRPTRSTSSTPSSTPSG